MLIIILEMTSSSRWVRYRLIVSVLTFFSLILTACLPSEPALLSYYEKHSAELGELAELISESSASLYQAGRWPIQPHEIIVHAEEGARFQQLMKHLGNPSLGIRDRSVPGQPEIFFILGERLKLMAFRTSKGIAYLPRPLVTGDTDFVVSSLEDAKPRTGADLQYFFRPIEGNWYLYQQEVE